MKLENGGSLVLAKVSIHGGILSHYDDRMLPGGDRLLDLYSLSYLSMCLPYFLYVEFYSDTRPRSGGVSLAANLAHRLNVPEPS